MLLHAITRLYFDDEAQANAADATLEAVAAARRHTLIARATGPAHYQFDIRLQGENETVFFEL
jgi:protocatechuate 3,4-dioxygenase alpha subunit